MAEKSINPTASDLEKILSSFGIECDLAKVKKVIDELNGKSIDEVIAQGQGKLASVPSGAAPTAASGGAAVPAAEEKKEEKKKEELAESESDDDMGFGLFD